MVRGIRLAFLALAALAVAAGWLLAHPLPFVVALIIAGIDVIETSFLLIVVRRSTGAPPGAGPAAAGITGGCHGRRRSYQVHAITGRDRRHRKIGGCRPPTPCHSRTKSDAWTPSNAGTERVYHRGQ